MIIVERNHLLVGIIKSAMMRRVGRIFLSREKASWAASAFKENRLKTTSELNRWFRYNRNEKQLGWNHGIKLSSLTGMRVFLVFYLSSIKLYKKGEESND